MFRVLCKKDGVLYVPKPDVRDIEFVIYYKTYRATEATEGFFERAEPRIEIEFKDLEETQQKEVHHQLINCPDSFKKKFYEIYERI